MPRKELKFPDWLREARRILAYQGPTALRDNIGEQVDEDQAKAALMRLLQECPEKDILDFIDESEAKDIVVRLVVYIDSREAVSDDENA